jgi:hypothetical protein
MNSVALMFLLPSSSWQHWQHGLNWILQEKDDGLVNSDPANS